MVTNTYKSSNMADKIGDNMTVLSKLKEAFPDRYKETEKYTSFNLGYHATIYVDHHNDKLAKIRETCFKNFPNSDELEMYIKNNNIPIKDVASHPDAEIDINHIDPIILILKKTS